MVELTYFKSSNVGNGSVVVLATTCSFYVNIEPRPSIAGSTLNKSLPLSSVQFMVEIEKPVPANSSSVTFVFRSDDKLHATKIYIFLKCKMLFKKNLLSIYIDWMLKV